MSPPHSARALPGLALIACLGACAGLSGGVYRDGATRFRVGDVPASWQSLALEGNDVTWLSRDSAHSVAVNATCVDHEDSNLAVLTRHLLMGFSQQQVVTQATVTLDGREGLRSHVLARLDGVAVELVLVVLKKNGCVYDFTYLSPPGRAAERSVVFEQLLATFTTELPL
jgi:hypothetical protein